MSKRNISERASCGLMLCDQVRGLPYIDNFFDGPKKTPELKTSELQLRKIFPENTSLNQDDPKNKERNTLLGHLHDEINMYKRGSVFSRPSIIEYLGKLSTSPKEVEGKINEIANAYKLTDEQKQGLLDSWKEKSQSKSQADTFVGQN